MNKSSKIWSIILITLLMTIGFLFLLSSNNYSQAVKKTPSDFGITGYTTAPGLLADKWYCISSGRTRWPAGMPIYCTGSGTCSDDEAWIIAHYMKSRNGFNYESDFLTNYFHSSSSVAGASYNSPSISISGPTGSESNPLIADEDGKYGPFKINCPSDSTATLTVVLNNTTTLTGITPNTEFYLREDQLKLGEKNTIKATYSYTKYYAAWATYATHSGTGTITVYESDAIAGGATENAYYKPLERIEAAWDACAGEDFVWPWSPRTSSDWVTGLSVYREDGEIVYIVMSYPVQELKRVDWDSEPDSVSDDHEFWPGKPDINIDLNKVDPAGGTVSGAKFQIDVTNGRVKSGVNVITTSGTNSIVIKPNGNPSTITVKFTEIEPASDDYVLLKGPFTATYTWSGGKWTLSGLTKNSDDEVTAETTGTKNSFKIKAVNKQKIKIDILKTDTNSTALEGIIFDAKVSGGTFIGYSSTNATVATDGSGKIHLEIEPTNTSDVSVTLTEHESTYYMKLDPITINFTYRSGWTPAVSTTSETASKIEVSGDAKITINIKNTAKIDDLELFKTNANFPEEILAGMQFRITFSNAEPLDRRTSYTTDSNGKINVGTIKVLNPSQPVTITLEEVDPGIDGVNFHNPGVITISVKHKSGPISVSGGNGLFTATYTNNVIRVDAKNIFTIDLSGRVWLDGQTGLKPVKTPNGKIDGGENGIEGILVDLVGVNPRITNTDRNGEYSFKEVPVRMDGTTIYYIEFTYDGIKYVVCPQSQQAGSDSVVQEEGRAEFNNKFNTIEKDFAVSADGTKKTKLSYTHNADKTEAYVDTSEFTMSATTLPNRYNKNTSNINMGLVAKEVDLAAVTDLYSVKVEINDKSYTYRYGDLYNLGKDANGNPLIDGEQYNNRVYALDLYLSDYNYRIKDYSISNPTHFTDIANNTDNTSLASGKGPDDLLQVKATYQILLNNKSATASKINQIAYYYDSRYDGIEIDGHVTATLTPTSETIRDEAADVTYKKVLINLNGTLGNFTDTDNQEMLEVILTVGKDANGNIYEETLKTFVEITSYTTWTSCIDKNSAPDNLGDGFVEDDTDDASGLGIKVGSKVRQIGGFVFEDLNGDGVYQNTDAMVNDVIVQLIELKKSGNLKLEYIWQETVTGSGKNDGVNVRKLKDDGTGEETYHIDNGDGEYHFKQIIPGDYIIRFIYGDGTYYDYAIDGSTPNQVNIRKYNGQTYQSTIDPYYDSTDWTSGNINLSVARDNESRRLYQIDAVRADGSLVHIDSKEELNKTWMCAETSKIDMRVEDEAVDSNGNRYIRPQSSELSFGLKERESLNLTLEKHVTQLNVGGTEKIIDTSANINDYYQGDTRYAKVSSAAATQGIRNPVEASSRKDNQIGLWYAELLREEVNGKAVTITYKYKITNAGERREYVGSHLIHELNLGESYNEIAENVKGYQYSGVSTDVYTIGNYLGREYYTGEASTITDEEMPVNLVVEDYTSVDSNQPVLSGGAFTVVGQKDNAKIINASNEDGVEKVNIIRSDILTVRTTAETYSEVRMVLDVTGTSDYTYQSYVARLVLVDNNGNPIRVSPTGRQFVMNDEKDYVKTYNRSVDFTDVAPELFKYIGETVELTVKTGGEDPANNSVETKTLNTTIIIASGAAIIALAMILAKKFVFTKYIIKK